MEKPNIVLITIDSLRADHLGCYSYSRDTSPNIDKLASRGALFLEVISNGGRTPDSFPSILASQPPPLGEDEYRLIIQQSPTLAGLLKEAGYQTAAFHSNPSLTKFFHYDKGFNVFEDSLKTLDRARKIRNMLARYPGAIKLTMTFFRFLNRARSVFNNLRFSLGGQRSVAAERLTSQAISWIKQCQGSFFLWLHYMDVHWPYTPEVKYQSQFRERSVSRRRMIALCEKMRTSPAEVSPPEVETLIDLYDAEIKCTDDSIGFLLDKLGDYSANTIVVVAADHGDALGQHEFGHRSLYDEVLRVPLIIAGPGIKAGSVFKTPAELIDLAPTVADFVGVSPVSNFHGKSLLPMISGKQIKAKGIISTVLRPAFGERSLSYRLPNWKYILTESLDGADTVLFEEVYDLKNDPQEINNRHGADSTEIEAFEREARKELSRFKQLKREKKTAYEKERIRAKLKKLA